MNEFEEEKFLEELKNLRDRMDAYMQGQKDFEELVITEFATLFVELNPEYALDRKEFIAEALKKHRITGYAIFSTVTDVFKHYSQTDKPYCDTDFEQKKLDKQKRKEESEAAFERDCGEIIRNFTPQQMADYLETKAEDEADEREGDLYHEKLHKCLKKCVVDFFEGIEDLPGRAFLELDDSLFYDEIQLNNNLYKIAERLNIIDKEA